MKKLPILKSIVILACLGTQVPAVASQDLIQVFNQALTNDPGFQATVAQLQSTKEGVAIARSYLLPQLTTQGNGQRNYLTTRAGTPVNIPGAGTTVFGVGQYDFNYGQYQINLSQSVFDYAMWAGLSKAKYFSKAADAQYTAALQQLMANTATSYFNVLSAEDNLRYIEAEKKATYQQLDQARQQYKVGVIPVTNVYQAQAEYDSLLSQEIAAQNNVINQRENLRAITGIYYNDLAVLKGNLPLISPLPANPSDWVMKAVDQNWSLIAQKLNAAAYQANIHQQFAGHLPTVSAYASNVGTKAGLGPGGRVNQTQNVIGVQVNFPVFQGGLVSAQTQQAEYDYQNAFSTMQQTYRQVVDNTHTSYNDVVSGINQVRADRQSILSNASSLKSTIEGYKVGTQTMLDVLQAQQNLYQAEQQFSIDEYAYINATIALKQAAGTLSLRDLQIINAWLSKTKKTAYSSLNIQTIQAQAQRNYQATVKANKDLGIDTTETNMMKAVKDIQSQSLTGDDTAPADTSGAISR